MLYLGRAQHFHSLVSRYGQKFVPVDKAILDPSEIKYQVIELWGDFWCDYSDITLQGSGSVQLICVQIPRSLSGNGPCCIGSFLIFRPKREYAIL